MDNYNNAYAGLFISCLINDIGQREVGLLSYHLKLEGRWVAHILFAYVILWMKGANAINFSAYMQNCMIFKSLSVWIIHDHIRSEFWQMTMSLSTSDGRSFSLLLN